MSIVSKANVLNDTPKEQFGSPIARVCAYLVDYVIIMLICCPIVYLMGINPLALIMAPNIHGVGLTIFVVTAAYTIPQIAISGATVGKKLLRLRVVRTDGFTLGYMHSILRWIGFIMLAIISGLSGALLTLVAIACIGCLIFHPQRRAPHDLLAGTAVIKN